MRNLVKGGKYSALKALKKGLNIGLVRVSPTLLDWEVIPEPALMQVPSTYAEAEAVLNEIITRFEEAEFQQESIA